MDAEVGDCFAAYQHFVQEGDGSDLNVSVFVCGDSCGGECTPSTPASQPA
jgi:hypothetical protein